MSDTYTSRSMLGCTSRARVQRYGLHQTRRRGHRPRRGTYGKAQVRGGRGEQSVCAESCYSIRFSGDGAEWRPEEQSRGPCRGAAGETREPSCSPGVWSVETADGCGPAGPSSLKESSVHSTDYSSDGDIEPLKVKTELVPTRMPSSMGDAASAATSLAHVDRATQVAACPLGAGAWIYPSNGSSPAPGYVLEGYRVHRCDNIMMIM